MAKLTDIATDVNKHADIVQVVQSYIPLTKKGRNFVGLCPFHDDSNPSFTVSPEKQFCKCFVCGVGGTAINFVQRYEKITFAEAIKKVADLSDYHPTFLDEVVHQKPVDEKKESLLKCLHDLNLYYQFALNSPEGKDGLEYFESRHLDKDLRSKYRLGYANRDGVATINFLKKKGHSIKVIEGTGIASAISPSEYKDMNEGRVIFPICDQDGNVIGFSARRLIEDDSHKYINSPETYLFHKSSVLYNYHIAKNTAKLKGYIYVLEGFMDVFALGRIGIDNAVAIMGTALTSEHISMLRALNVEIRLCLDGDLAGQRAMMKISNELNKAGLKFRIVDNEGSPLDPDEILNQQGKEALEAYLNKLLSRTDFALNYYMRSNPLKTVDEKKKLIKEFIPILAGLTSQLELDSYLRRLEKITGFEKESIAKLVTDYCLNQNREEVVTKVIKDFHPERKMLRRLSLAERALLYQMIGNSAAVDFYEENNMVFYDDIYRAIAAFLIEYQKKYHNIDSLGIITEIENSDLANKEDIINDLNSIIDEDFQPQECTPELLNNLLETIDQEKEKINEEDLLNDSLKGKGELDKARIIADYNRRKALKNKKD